jgi:signal transduction histidine kinase
VQGAATQKWIFLTGKFDSNIQQFRGLIYDITERKNVESDRSILLAKLNHELRTPLATIKLCTQRSLITARAARLDIASLLEKADHQINRMNNLIDEFLLVSLNDSKRIILKKSFFYLKDVINEVLNDSFFGEHNERITISIDETQRLFADREKLVQVLNNYISNAVKYSPMDGRIIISCEQGNEKLKVSVRDFGIGVSVIEQQKLFQKYYRCQNVGRIQGYGIGLFVVREIIEAHQGEVGIVSQIGEGSTFYFTLPINKSYQNS